MQIYKGYKQLMTFVIFVFPALLYAQEDNTNRFPVYHNNDIVGYLYTDTDATLDEEECYTLDTLDVFGKQLIVQIPVTYRGYYDGTTMFFPYRFIELETSNNSAFINFNNSISSGMERLTIKKEKSGAIYIYEELSYWPNSHATIKIGEDDFSSASCSHICIKAVHKLVGDRIVFSDLNGWTKRNILRNGLYIMAMIDFCPIIYILTARIMPILS